MDLHLLFDLPTKFIHYDIFFQIALAWFLVQYIILIYYLLSVRKVLIAIRPHNRAIHPDIVWLGLIPVFRLVWPFVLNPLLCTSIKRDMTESGIDEYGDYGLVMGIAYPFLGLVKYFIPFGSLISVPEFLIWVFFWRKLNEYRNRIVEAGGVSEHTDLLDS